MFYCLTLSLTVAAVTADTSDCDVEGQGTTAEAAGGGDNSPA